YQLQQQVPRIYELDGGVLPLLATLTVHGNYNKKGASRTSGDGLVTAIRKRLPTLLARDRNSSGKCRSRKERTGKKNGDNLPQTLGGPLNPHWAEWFMGWPIGATELKR
ncbi:MAG: hypothetical protein ABH852_04905, partial [Methanobacteriota archaeon]